MIAKMDSRIYKKEFRNLLACYLLLACEKNFSTGGQELRFDYACFNTLFEISCSDTDIILFESARYGRNNATVATRCDIPFTRNCDIDVHFPLNRACAGRSKCTLAVNTGFFGDPCGYEEFLAVSYRCVQVSEIRSKCSDSSSALQLLDHGYLSSPNYPGKYFMDVECFWQISVPKWQTIRLTLLDFEMDVKRGGRCYDLVEILVGDEVFFSDCGALGKQVLDIPASEATVLFRTGRSSITQRGFMIHFEGSGPGCAEYETAEHLNVTYFQIGGILFANASCEPGFHFAGIHGKVFLTLECLGVIWSSPIPECVAVHTYLVPSVKNHSPTASIPFNRVYFDRPAMFVGIGLGVAIVVFLLISLATAFHYHRLRRQTAERKLDQWMALVNNLQENVLNDACGDVTCAAVTAGNRFFIESTESSSSTIGVDFGDQRTRTITNHSPLPQKLTPSFPLHFSSRQNERNGDLVECETRRNDGASAAAASLYVFRIDRSLKSSRWRRRSIQSLYAQGQRDLNARPATAEAQGLEPPTVPQPDTFLPEIQHSVQKAKYRILDRPDVVPRRAVSACLRSITAYQFPAGSSESPVLDSEPRGGNVRLCLPIKDLVEPKASTSNASSPFGPKEFQIRCTTI